MEKLELWHGNVCHYTWYRSGHSGAAPEYICLEQMMDGFALNLFTGPATEYNPTNIRKNWFYNQQDPNKRFEKPLSLVFFSVVLHFLFCFFGFGVPSA
jgi:hypothetical protein